MAIDKVEIRGIQIGGQYLSHDTKVVVDGHEVNVIRANGKIVWGQSKEIEKDMSHAAIYTKHGNTKVKQWFLKGKEYELPGDINMDLVYKVKGDLLLFTKKEQVDSIKTRYAVKIWND